MEYLTIKETAGKWNISERRIQILCRDGRIEGIIKFGRAWAIPADAIKPGDNRVKTGKYVNWRKKHRSMKEDFEMNEKERISYVKALVYIALADDTIEEGEDKYLDQIGSLYGIPEAAIEEIKNSVKAKKETLNEILADITDRKIKLSLVYELLALCYADDNYSVIEKQGMKNICEIMGIESDKLSQFEEVMEEQVELQKKVNVLLER